MIARNAQAPHRACHEAVLKCSTRGLALNAIAARPVPSPARFAAAERGRRFGPASASKQRTVQCYCASRGRLGMACCYTVECDGGGRDAVTLIRDTEQTTP